jgi:flagellar M-ring protein FliF
VGRIKRISVAIVVDGTLVEDAAGNSTWTPRTPDEMEKFEELVSKAVGLDSSRGDQIAVVNTRFESPEVLEPLPEIPFWVDLAVKWGTSLLLMLVLAFGVVRPMITAWQARPTLVPASGPPLTDEELGRMALDPTAGALPAAVPATGERLRLQAIESTKDDPKRAAQIIRAWLLVED